MTYDKSGGGLMSVEQARAILGPETVAELEALPVVPLAPEQIARIAPILRAALARTKPAGGWAT